MKKAMLLNLAIVCVLIAHSQTGGYLKKDDGSSGSVNCYSVYEDGDGLTGIGTTAPAASLHINRLTSSTADFLSITRTTIGGPPSYAHTEYSKFIVKENGNVGIGIAEPLALLHISSDKTLAAFDENMFNQVKVAGTNADGDPFFVISDMSYLDGSTHHPVGFLGVITEGDVFSFGVMNLENSSVALGASGNGNIVVNMPLIDAPYAQVDVRPATAATYILNIGNSGPNPLMRLSSTGNLGIGIHPTTSTIAVKGTSDTKVDLVETSTTVDYNAQLRFIASDGSTVRHLITENSAGELLIKTGYAGGAEPKLQVAGDVKITGTTDIDGRVKIGSQSITSGSHTDAKLYVDGKVAAKACVVTLDHWSDYVFEEKYPLQSLEALTKLIKEEKHLPGIPSANDVISNGNNLGEMDAKLLEKIEELFLYVIQLYGKNLTLEERIKLLETYTTK